MRTLKTPVFGGRLSFILFGLGAGIVVVEILVPVFFPLSISGIRLNKHIESERGKFCRYDPVLGWDGIPYARGSFEWVDCRHAVSQNSRGYRDREHEFTRSPKKRLVVLGDSFVWGFGVENKDIFTSLMERERSSTLEVVNLGVSGFGTDQELLLWRKKGRLWKPDEVLLVIAFMNDLDDNSSPLRYGYPKPVFAADPQGRIALANVPVPEKVGDWAEPVHEVKSERRGALAHLFDRSAVACLLFAGLSQNPSARTLLTARGVLPRTGYDADYTFFQTSFGAIQEQSWGLMSALIGALSSDVRKEGARLTLVIAPSICQVYPERWEQLTREDFIPPGTALNLDVPNRRILEIGRKFGLNVIDLSPDLRKAGGKNNRLYYPMNFHWTEDGHRVVANTLLDQMHLRK